MEFYVILFIICVYWFYHKSDTERNRWRFIRFITFVLIMIAGLRHQYVGNDTINYLNNFDSVSNMNWENVMNDFVNAYFNPNKDNGKDPAMLVLNMFLCMFITDHAVYLTIMASILLIPLAFFLKLNVKSFSELLFVYLFYIALYYGFLPNSAVRQSIALGFILIGSIIYQKSENRLSFLMFVLLGSFFHKSALLGILYLGASYVRFQRLLFLLGIPLFIVMLYGYEIVGLSLSSQSEIYSMYSGTYYTGINKPFVILFLYAALYVTALLRINKLDNNIDDSPHKRLMLSGSMFSVVFVPLILLDPSLVRISSYFFLWLGILVPRCIYFYPKKWSKILFGTFIILFIYKAYKSGLDYAFFWQIMQQRN